MRSKKNKSKPKGFTALILLLIILLGALYAQRYYKDSLGAMVAENPSDINIIIPPSSSTTKITNILYENGLIKNQLIFKYKVKSMGVGGKLKAGEYSLSTGMDVETIIDNLIKGGKSKNTLRFTIPEGYELRQMAEKLSEEGIVDYDRFLELTSDKSNFEDKFTFLKDLN